MSEFETQLLATLHGMRISLALLFFIQFVRLLNELRNRKP